MTLRVAVTGAYGFVGRHVCRALSRLPATSVIPIAHEPTVQALLLSLDRADVVIHLAGANRPADKAEFTRSNEMLTQSICNHLLRTHCDVPVLLASSTQAGNGTPYGDSKLAAEKALEDYVVAGGSGIVFRFPGIFGKGCRPNYNSVVATFVHAITHTLSYRVEDPRRLVTLMHVDSAVNAILGTLQALPASRTMQQITSFPSRTLTLGDLAHALESFAELSKSLRVPDFSDEFVRALYSTFMSYQPVDRLDYVLEQRRDERGELAEFFKSAQAGQMFVSTTRPGISRGHHWHETKVEKFLVLSGAAMIRFRAVEGDGAAEYLVRGDELRVVNIPPGFVHSIENVGDNDLITLFWACDVFDPENPDTHRSGDPDRA